MNNDLPFDLDSVEDAGMADGFVSAGQAAASAEEELRIAEEIRANKTEEDHIYEEKNFLKRARALRISQGITFPDMKALGAGMESPNPNSDGNRMAFFNSMFDNGSGRCPFPYYDTFRAMAVDHEGNQITELHSHAEIMTSALSVVGMKNQSYASVDAAFRRFALKFKRNSLQEHVKAEIPVWDGEERLDGFLVDFFKLRDTDLNRVVCRYFWFSLYNRIMNPGCQAPISITLIGDQNTGKSYFYTLLCKLILASQDADTVPLDLSLIEKNSNEWLRKITGASVIANLGEMRGYNRADMDTLKEFATRSGEVIHRKFEHETHISRQWIITADANRYDGFHRDDTGNRRFYPLFVDQIEDQDGQPAWNVNKGFTADFSKLHANFWQLFAEVEHHMEEHGMPYYDSLVGNATRAVAQFSRDEMSAGRGIIKDEAVETAIRTILLGASMESMETKVNQGTVISNSEIQRLWNRREKGSINWNAVRRTLTAIGFETAMIKGFGRCYILRGVIDVHLTKRYIWTSGTMEELESIRADADKWSRESDKDSVFNAALGREVARNADASF